MTNEESHAALEALEKENARLRAERDGLRELLDRHEEIKAKVAAQVIAGDAIRKASI